MGHRRWLALCGIAAPLLIALAVTVVGGSTPQSDASPEKVVSFYRGHLTSSRTAGLMVSIGAVLLVLFAARLRELLQDAGTGSGAFTLAAFGGAVLSAAGLLFAAAVHFALVDAADKQFAAQAQTLNVLDNDVLSAAIVGLSVFFLGAGIAIVRRPVLPRWLGWAAIVLGIVSLAGPLGFLAALLGLVWLLVVGIIMFLRADDTAVDVIEVIDIDVQS